MIRDPLFPEALTAFFAKNEVKAGTLELCPAERNTQGEGETRGTRKSARPVAAPRTPGTRPRFRAYIMLTE